MTVQQDVPSGSVEAPDELFDLPHLNVGFRYILRLAHIWKTLERSGSSKIGKVRRDRGKDGGQWSLGGDQI